MQEIKDDSEQKLSALLPVNEWQHLTSRNLTLEELIALEADLKVTVK